MNEAYGDPSADDCKVDFAAGVARMMNNRGLYVRLLTKFTASNNIEAVRDSVAQSDLGRIHIEAHTLKGVAGNLGLDMLAAKAADLDSAAQKGEQGNLQELLASLEFCFEQTMAAIASFIAE